MNKQMDFISYDPVRFSNWIIKISKDVKTNNHLIVMINRSTLNLRVSFKSNEVEANDYIAFILEGELNG